MLYFTAFVAFLFGFIRCLLSYKKRFVLSVNICFLQSAKNDSFKMFSFDESGKENIVHEYYAYSSEEIDDFNKSVSYYMDKAVLFVNTINGVIHTGQ